MSDERRFVVIRHGESQTNATNTFQAGNQYDSDGLTPRGTEVARRLAERLADLPVDVVLSSSYLRARTTAGLVAEATGSRHLVPVQDGASWTDLRADDPDVRDGRSLLREIDVPSELAGLRFDDPKAHGVLHAAMEVAEHPDAHYSDEENLHDLWRRAEQIRHYLEARTEGLVVVVAHGGILKVWLAHLMFTAVAGLDTPAQLAAYRGFTRLGWWDNTGVVSLRYRPEGAWMWLMTDIAHLGPEYLSFMPSEPPVPRDTGAGYLGAEDGEEPD
jgi:broad specificity phosphatase PhoE